MESIKEIQLCFENVTSASIQTDDIDMLKINGITTSLSIDHATKKQKNNYSIQYNCASFNIILLKSANKNGIYNGYGESIDVFDRLKQYNDIVSIILTYEDNTEKEIFMKWSGNENNNLQHTSMIEDKLHISID